MVPQAAKRCVLNESMTIFSCLIIFFSALAGIGYVDPDTTPSPAAHFVLGSPVYDASTEQLEVARQRSTEQRELEREWQKKRRPHDVSAS